MNSGTWQKSAPHRSSCLDPFKQNGYYMCHLFCRYETQHLFTECVRVFRMILKLNNDYFPNQYSFTGLRNGHVGW
jgi:hypothetical protein